MAWGCIDPRPPIYKVCIVATPVVELFETFQVVGHVVV